MFSALKKKALDRVEQLKNLDALCDDKQREAAAADAATAKLLAEMNPNPVLPALPVPFLSAFTPALPSSIPSTSSSGPSAAPTVSRPIPRPPVTASISEKSRKITPMEPDPFEADLMEAGLVRTDASSAAITTSVDFSATLKSNTSISPILLPPSPPTLPLGPRPSLPPPPPLPLPASSSSSSAAPGGWFGTPGIPSFWGNGEEVKPVLPGPSIAHVPLGPNSALAGALYEHALPTLTGEKPKAAASAPDAVKAGNALPQAPEEDSIRGYILGMLWVLAPAAEGTRRSCASLKEKIGRYCCCIYVLLACFTRALHAGLQWCSRASCNQRTIALVLGLVIAIALWRIVCTFVFVDASDSEG